ncbi:hypothetical protein L1987_60915 [Smallanthus sonchifolius]|uniref:Uncharacterized protein n=1 Tax=Smallanthus sonchifolius TaxID=185202 RepID=A0ACB9D9B9_9ASTR|nr:hypothetical protein L1987_60915 [Smallanthus sonchifolius]
MGNIMKSSSFALTEAKYVAGDNIKYTVIENVKTASLKVRSRTENVAGVKLPKFEYFTEAESKNELTGLARGGQQVQGCKAAYVKAIEVLVELASLQTSFLTLDEAIKTTNRRVNALESVVNQEQAAENLSLQRGISMNAAHNMLSATQKDDDIIF